MKSHKFAVGQTVRYLQRVRSNALSEDSFKITRLLPPEANDFQYRVKSEGDGHERVVKESQLS